MNTKKTFEIRYYIKLFKYNFIFIVMVKIIIAFLSIYKVRFLQEIIDNALDYNRNALIKYFIISGILMVISMIIEYISINITCRFTINTSATLKKDSIIKFTKMKMDFIDNQSSGEIVSRIINDVNNLSTFISDTIIAIIYNVLIFIGATIYLIIINWKLYILIIITFPLSVYLIGKVTSRLETLAEEQKKGQVKSTELQIESVNGFVIQKAYNLQETFFQKYVEALKVLFKNSMDILRINAKIDIISLFMKITPFAVCVTIGAYLIIKNNITPGNFLAYINLMNYVLNPIMQTGYYLSKIKTTKGIKRHFVRFMDEDEEINGAILVPSLKSPCIQFNNVFFAYDKRMILNDINIEIHEGEHCAIVGKSGSGKSTLIKLISGLYKPIIGEVKVYGSTTSQWNLSKMRDYIAVVSQEVQILPMTFYDNIAYGNENYTIEEIINASKLAEIHDFIELNEKGYNTMIGEHGITLSGGEKQRISIARAILKNPPIIIFDEATSALDVKTERNVIQNLYNHFKYKTIIIISHNLETINWVDKIYLLSEGRIIEK